MDAKNSGVAKDKSASERRKGLSDAQVKDLELAGGVEGGMKAGSAGGPGANEQTATPNTEPDGA